MGFFSPSVLAQYTAPIVVIPRCGACGLFKICHTPKMTVGGEGRRGILIVGAAPDAAEDHTGDHHAGSGGDMLRRAMWEHGIDLNRDCWSTNALICHAGGKYPTEEQIGHCAPNLRATIEALKPSTIIPLGAAANRAVLSLIWTDDIGPFARWAGFRIPSREWNAWICPTWSPVDIQREKKALQAVKELWWNRHLQAAVELSERPWRIIPDEKSEIELIYDSEKAARIIRKMVERGGVCAFDYETNMLKPEGPGSEIVSCSICWQGKKTIAYPWRGEAVTATDEFLCSPLPKVASNMKFEERWTKNKLGHRVRNWVADTMLDAHLCDTRQSISSIKFQAFVRMGVLSYNKHIHPLLESDGPMVPNRIKEIDLADLLLYNGLDSLLEFRVAERQAVELAIPFGGLL